MCVHPSTLNVCSSLYPQCVFIPLRVYPSTISVYPPYMCSSLYSLYVCSSLYPPYVCSSLYPPYVCSSLYPPYMCSSLYPPYVCLSLYPPYVCPSLYPPYVCLSLHPSYVCSSLYHQCVFIPLPSICVSLRTCVHVYPAGLIAMAVRAIALLQRISLDLAVGPCKCTSCVCLSVGWWLSFVRGGKLFHGAPSPPPPTPPLPYAHTRIGIAYVMYVAVQM